MEKLTLVDMRIATPGGLGVNRKSELNQSIGFRETGNILTYSLRGNSRDVNREVLEMMTVAAQDIIDLSTPMFSGDYTAKELAGKVCGCFDMVTMFTASEYVDYALVCITTGKYKCEFPCKDIFQMMAEWEVMMGVTQKKAHRFPCEAEKKMDKDVPVKAYKCSRTFHYPSGKIYDPDEETAEKKYGALGRVCRSLTDEGMYKAYSVVTAVKAVERNGLYAGDKEMLEMAKEMMWHKLCRDYGTASMTENYNKDIFKYAPKCWKQTDKAYEKTLTDAFYSMAKEAPRPEWPKKDDEVQFKNQDNTVKKWQGKLRVLNVFPEMDFYDNRIVWKASVCTTKGKWHNVIHPVDRFEAFAEPEPTPKRKASQVKSEKRRVKNESNPEPFTLNHEPEAKPSFADLLRKALQAA